MEMDWTFLFDDRANVIEAVITTVIAYTALVILLRISGKRTLADMNAFDFVVTVALGSTLATTILSASVSLVEGVAVMVALVVLQALVAAFSARSDTVREAVQSEPTLLVRHGTLLRGAMRAQRLSEAEVFAAIRAEGEADLKDVSAVVLETNGDLSVITDRADYAGRALGAVT